MRQLQDFSLLGSNLKEEVFGNLILVGDRETVGFLEIADDIYWLRDWRRYGSGETQLPGATRSLTATYFPGALRTPDSHDRTVSGAQAAKAVAAGPSAPRNQ